MGEHIDNSCIYVYILKHTQLWLGMLEDGLIQVRVITI